MWHYMHDSTFIHFDKIPKCETHTDRQTDTRRRHIPHLAQRCAVKIDHIARPTNPFLFPSPHTLSFSSLTTPPLQFPLPFPFLPFHPSTFSSLLLPLPLPSSSWLNPSSFHSPSFLAHSANLPIGRYILPSVISFFFSSFYLF